MERQSKTKTAVVVLAALLCVSALALVGTLTYGKLSGAVADASATVTDNQISQSGGGSSQSASEVAQASSAQAQAASNASAPASSASAENHGNQASGTTSTTTAQPSASTSSAPAKKETKIELYGLQPEENTPFHVGNMFPGDSETKSFRVRVSYRDKVTVHFGVTVREGYEKLAEVMKVRITLPASGEVIYDGLMRDVPQSLNQDLSFNGYTASELQYQVTAYLETSVGNDYQNKDLIADLTWWVAEDEKPNLTPLPIPNTGDPLTFVPVICTVLAAAAIILAIASRVRKGGERRG